MSHSLSVIIPSYQRPEWLERAVNSLLIQARLPQEVVIAVRDTDEPTHRVVGRLAGRVLPFALRRVDVAEPGFMPPVRAGLRAARADILAVMDDDAEALPDWAERLVGHYSDPTVGAVGGRVIQMNGTQILPVGLARRVGYLNWRGVFVGRLAYHPTFRAPVDVLFMMGGCMSFRRSVADALDFDMDLNRDVSFAYEVDLGLQVRRMNLRIIYDPLAAIRHYNAPRTQAGMRQRTPESVFWYAHNDLRIALRWLGGGRRWIGIPWRLIIGERRAPGVLPFLLYPLSRLFGFENSLAVTAFRGRLHAIRNRAR